MNSTHLFHTESRRALVRLEHCACGLLLVSHLVVSTIYMRPATVHEMQIPTARDYPMHVHRVAVFREALFSDGLPWGIDPRSGAGFILNPGQDISKPQQLLGVLFPFASAGPIVIWFAYTVVVLYPVMIGLACRLFGLTSKQSLAAMTVVLALLWTSNSVTNLVRIGMMSFFLSSAVSALALATFYRFAEQPGMKRWLVFCVTGSALFFAHVVGPLAIIPVLVGLTVCTLRGRWQLLAMGSPLVILVVNAFWVIPLILAITGPRPEWLGQLPQFSSGARYYTYNHLGRLLDHLMSARSAMSYLGLFAMAVGGRAVLVRSGRRRLGNLLCAAFFWSLALQWFGSFVPGLSLSQPLRFITTTVIFAAILGGVWMVWCLQQMRIPLGIAVIAICCLLPVNVVSGRKEPLSWDGKSLELREFIAEHTIPKERMLVEECRRFHEDPDHTPRALHLLIDREVIGDPYLDITDSIQFRNGRLFGRPLDEWSNVPSETLITTVRRWGVHWVFTHRDESRKLFETAFKKRGQKIGTFYAFRVPGEISQFVEGAGAVTASVNRIVVKVADAPW